MSAFRTPCWEHEIKAGSEFTALCVCVSVYVGPVKIICVDRAHGRRLASLNLRHGGLHVLPASAEVVLQLAQWCDAQLLFELGVLPLFGRQHLPQRADLLLQLDAHKHRKGLINTLDILSSPRV